jgi:DNA-binding SARP family transcriptional activator/ABC-type glycerol-3-phosphate transport system substrate-binding protein
VEFRILGPLEVVEDGRALAIASPQQRALLALLVINPNRVLSPDWIADRLWDGRLPDSGTKALAFHVSKLRDSLAPDRLPGRAAGGVETEAAGYILRVTTEGIDAARFERLAREGHALLAADPARARTLLNEALGLWRGEALADVAYLEFAQVEIRRLAELRLDALEDRLEADLALGGHAVAVAELEPLVAANPLRERLRGLLMLALYRCGRQAEALRVAGAGRRILSEELGIDPSPELVQLEARILRQDAALSPPRGSTAESTGAARARNPYKGLRAFGEGDSGDFFGREALIARLMGRVEQVSRAGRLLAVVGPSGSGKSSVVLAGLVPALRAVSTAGATTADGATAWRVATMVPGNDPVGQLAAALAATGRRVPATMVDAARRSGDLAPLLRRASNGTAARLLLVIDQLEELFVRVEPAVQARFLGGIVAALRAPGASVAVVATLRADFLHVPLAEPDLGELLRDGVELVTPMSRAELERAISRPAEAVGVELEAGLVPEIVADVERRPGALPLLQYALTELFERSDGRRITRDAYRAIGGVAGALGQQAEEAWRALDPAGQEVAQQALLALVTVGDGGAVAARRVPRHELESVGLTPAAVDAVLAELARRGLVTFDRDRVTGAPTAEIAHEALLSGWPRLAAWIDELREDIATRRRLADAAAEWAAAGQASAYLPAGARLERFEGWAKATRLRLAEGERAYLAAGAAERQRLAAMDVERLTRERRLEHRASVVRRALVGVLVVGLVVAGGLGAALLRQQGASVEDADVAGARELAAASLGKERDLSILLALRAAEATAERGYVTEEAYDALQWALQDAQVATPAGVMAVGVRAAAGGPRGMYLVSPDVLIRLASEYLRGINRQFTPDECQTYLRTAVCPQATAAPGGPLGIRTIAGLVTAASLAVGSVPGTRVRVLSELPIDVSPLLSSFAATSGIAIDWQAPTNGDLRAAVAAGDLPDVAIVARPSTVALGARGSWLIDLSGRIDMTSLADLDPYASALGHATFTSGSGVAAPAGLYGVPIAATVSDLLWYRADAFARAGYGAPTTPADLESLISRLHADGHTPWCFGTKAGARSGEAAVAWVDDLVLQDQGFAGYDGWTHGDVRFGSSTIRAAIDAFGRAVKTPGAVFGGIDSAILTPARFAALPMTAQDPPGCWLYRGASTDRPALGERAVAVPLPGPGRGPKPVLGSVFLVVLLHDRPEARSVVTFLTGATFAAAMPSAVCPAGVFPVRNGPVPAACVRASDGARLRASLASGTFRVRAGDLLPDAVAEAFRGDLLAYLSEGDLSSADRDFSADAAWADLRAEALP